MRLTWKMVCPKVEVAKADKTRREAKLFIADRMVQWT